ncbi:sec-independent protein translocase protein [Salmonella enterica subsp. enterica]|uniref:Sec-independent protein translocase protein n=1 Tax=Salmonella enterica I TaxID=59201 RepID=A0A447N0X8_SALET|nr:sec-independent protein translocase protein [Salmonella enterica subsp. enterica]
MFDIGFSELLLVFVIGLIVLGPQRLPVAVKNGSGLDSRVAIPCDNGSE